MKYQQKQILVTSNGYGLGDGMAGADTYCQSQFGERGSTWKALMVGGGRTATVTPNAGDGQEDWVVHPYTEYYNWEGGLSWVTHDVALLGVRDGQRVDLLQPATEPYAYPWSGYADDWTTVSDQTCSGWTSVAVEDAGAFAFDDLTYAAVEPCDRHQPLVCVEQ